MVILTRLQKKKLLVAITVCAVAIDAQMPRERLGNVHRWVLVLAVYDSRCDVAFRDRRAAMVALGQLTDVQFKRRFRMTRMSFESLLATIRHDLERDEDMAGRSSRDPVFPYLQLAIALRYLAGGSYLDISDVYKVSVGNSSGCCFHNVVSCVVQVHESTVMEVVWRGMFRALSCFVFCITCFCSHRRHQQQCE
jgi:hypothetical protein